MTTPEQRITETVATHLEHHGDEYDLRFSASIRKLSAHLTAMLAPVIRDELRGAFAWMSKAVTEAGQNAPAPSSTPDLASAFWNGYRDASREVSDLLVEPKLIEKAINHRSNDE